MQLLAQTERLVQMAQVVKVLHRVVLEHQVRRVRLEQMVQTHKQEQTAHLAQLVLLVLLEVLD
jgi:hypothetical protein